MKISKAIYLALMLGFASGTVLAITPDPSDQNIYQREFRLLDTNNDSKVSATEIKKDPIFEEGGFNKADKNHDGNLSQDEYASYKSAAQQVEAKRVARDSAITSKVKANYLLEKNFRSFKVSVETKDGVVILSGFVDDEATKKRAERIAASVKGVKSVKNGLVIKP